MLFQSTSWRTVIRFPDLSDIFISLWLYRISYAVFLMKKLKELFPNNNVQLMYDVACLLHKHIEVLETGLHIYYVTLYV